MSDSSLSSLGIGSGVLTYDVIDKLKEADEAAMISPLETRLENVQEKETSLTDLITQISLFKTTIADFEDGAIFQERTLDVTGGSVTASVTSGVSVQSISIDVDELAQNDLYQSKGYAAETTKINETGSDQTLTLSYGGSSEDITIEDNATLSDLRDTINDADIGIIASIIDTGSDTDPYKLVLRGTETGKDNIIKLDYHDIDDLNFNDTNYNSKEYTSDTDSVTSTDTTFKVTINGTERSMNVTAGTTVKDFVDQINTDLDQYGINASYNSSTNKIELDIDAIGEITIDEGDLNTAFNDNTTDGDNRLQTAQDASFSYNGIDVTRDSNTIDDLVVGLTINLVDEGESTINIAQDTDTISESVSEFVSSFNSLASNIQDLTKYDEDTGQTGIFQGESTINSIASSISDLLFSSFTTDTVTRYDRNDEEYEENIILNATDFGFSMTRTGLMDFDSEAFATMLNTNPDKVEEFLTNEDDDNESENGAFIKIIDYLDTLIDGDNSSLELLSSQYANEEDSYEESISSSQDLIDTKYEIMATQFASYDNVINAYNVQTMAIQQAIDAMSK